MNYGELLLNEVVENPHDDTPRTIYADWLEEHGDPRADFIRLQLRLRDPPVRFNQLIVLHLRDRQLRLDIELPWLRLMEYPLAPLPLDKLNVPASVIRHVPERFARRYRIIPLRCDGRRLWLAMGQARDMQTEDDLRNLLGFEIVPVGVWNLEVEYALQRFYPIDGVLPPGAYSNLGETFDTPAIPVAPLNLTIELLLRRAVEEHASEIHLEPMPNRYRVRFRVLQNQRPVLIEHTTLPVQMGSALLAQAKCLANLEVDQHSFPQDGSAHVAIGQQIQPVRISTLPTTSGESAILVLDAGNAD